jgi:hypothetical protein
MKKKFSFKELFFQTTDLFMQWYTHITNYFKDLSVFKTVKGIKGGFFYTVKYSIR